MRLLEAAHRRAGPAVDFVGVDEADSRRAALELLDASATTYPTVYDPDKSIGGRYHLEGMPTTVFVAAGGRVDAVVKGPLTEGQLRRRLRDLGEGPLTRRLLAAWASP